MVVYLPATNETRDLEIQNKDNSVQGGNEPRAWTSVILAEKRKNRCRGF